MIELTGKYSNVKIFVNEIEPEALAQIVQLINHESSEGSVVRIMPDTHAGAGRIMARGKAKRTLSLEDFQKSMEGIYTTCVSQNTIDESPMVYKNHEEIKELIKDTVDVKYIVKPIYNFKAGGE